MTDLYFLANSVRSVTSAQSTSPTATLYTLTLCLVQQHSWNVAQLQLHCAINIFFLWHNSPNWVRAPSFWSFWYHNETHYTRYDPSVRVIGPSHITPPNNAKNSQDWNIHAGGGIRTSNSTQPADCAATILRDVTPCSLVEIMVASTRLDGFTNKFTYCITEPIAANRTILRLKACCKMWWKFKRKNVKNKQKFSLWNTRM